MNERKRERQTYMEMRKRNEGKKKTWNEEVSKWVRDGGGGDIDRSAVAS